ncbi:MAG TPA: hypothetical protein VM779_03180 [Thermoanaerobaculia bacterium]|nr:hypothetical protein [Thermoanaerobaculia bacterium]
MKRLALFLLVVTHAAAAVAFNPTPVPGNRIGILNTAVVEEDLVTLRVASAIRGHLARELGKAGFEAFETRATLDEIADGDRIEADYYVEFVRGDSGESYGGGIGVAGRRGGVDLGIIGSYVSARLRLYDGRTLELIDELYAEASDRAVVPTSIGIGTGRGGIWIGLPVRMMRNRTVARQAAREAAESIVSLLRGEAERH